MKVFTAALLSVLATVAVARMPYQFSAGSENIIGVPVESFTCDNRQYGYYADVENDCKIFHICLPIEDDLGEIVRTDMYSFFCGNQTVFNQESLTCDHPGDAFPCAEAASLYDLVNSEFGRITDNDYAAV